MNFWKNYSIKLLLFCLTLQNKLLEEVFGLFVFLVFFFQITSANQSPVAKHLFHYYFKCEQISKNLL